MGQANPLRLMLHGFAIHNGLTKIFYYSLVNGIALEK